MMANTAEDTPPLIIHPNGAVEVSPELADHLTRVVGHQLQFYTPDLSWSTLTAVLAIAAGYSAGVSVVDRTAAEQCLASIMQAFEAGMGVGMECNDDLPRLHS